MTTGFSPMGAFIFAEEHPGSINDAYLQISMTDFIFPDMVASRHSKACTFGFADGHVEVHKWSNPNTYKPEIQGVQVAGVFAGVNSVDWLWVSNHASFKD